ncbi:putative Glycolipid transfer protein [Paratrimastix pyriformis]|uniref:Glycolipid transfer protein n=1 Tax=Paratrimastix pyriformis TaxID=342808 RepID=A0ABQ8UIY4_9EUKA|nr:putative Glycolipid transfer protein [Paratrimastix pyriformis]
MAEEENVPVPALPEGQSVFTPMVATLRGVHIQDNEIPTTGFLESMKLLNGLFNIIGPKKMAPVKNDINGNIETLENAFKTNPAAFPTLQSLVRPLIAGPKQKKGPVPSFLWLKRALEFMMIWMRNFCSTEMPMREAAQNAYEATLHRYHGFIVHQVFKVAFSSMPDRAGFLVRVGCTTPEKIQHFTAEVREWVELMTPFIQNMQQFLNANNLDDPSTPGQCGSIGTEPTQGFASGYGHFMGHLLCDCTLALEYRRRRSRVILTAPTTAHIPLGNVGITIGRTTATTAASATAATTIAGGEAYTNKMMSRGALRTCGWISLKPGSATVWGAGIVRQLLIDGDRVAPP